MEKNRERRLNSRQRSRVLQRLLKIKGYTCWTCGRTDVELVVDDVDNDGDYETPGKQQLLCRSCNTLKNPRGLGRFNPKRGLTIEEFDRGRSMSPEFEANRRAEPAFRRYVLSRVKQTGEMSLRDAVNAGCEYLMSKMNVPLSQQTAKRYIDKLTSPEGVLIMYREEDVAMIRLRSDEERFGPAALATKPATQPTQETPHE